MSSSTGDFRILPSSSDRRFTVATVVPIKFIAMNLIGGCQRRNAMHFGLWLNIRKWWKRPGKPPGNPRTAAQDAKRPRPLTGMPGPLWRVWVGFGG